MIKDLLAEFQAEIPSSRKCLERIPDSLYDWKPHEKSMNLGYLTVLVADIPRWISFMLDKREIDFLTFEQHMPKSSNEMLDFFDRNTASAISSFNKAAEEDLKKNFVLRRGDQIIIDSPLGENLSSTINHWVHHRGQLTVYMRLNDISVPSIYGPSADEPMFTK